MKILTKFEDFKKLNEDNGSIDIYMEDVKKNIIHIIKNIKKIPKFKAKEFINTLFSVNNENSKEINTDITNNFNSKQSAKNCARVIVNNYYDGMKYTEKESDSDADIVEVNEKNYFHYNNVSNSLFWNFIKRVSSFNKKFIFDTTSIDDNENTLNNKNYIFYIETDEINKNDIEYGFIHSRILSSILNVIKDGDMVKFFIGIDKDIKLNFGYIYGDDIYVIGKVSYTTNDIKKLSPYIECSDTSLSFDILSSKFKSTITIINFYKKVFINYLSNYVDLKIQSSVYDNKISLTIETDDDDILNEKYLYNIIKDNNKYKLKDTDFELYTDSKKNKTYYIFNLK